MNLTSNKPLIRKNTKSNITNQSKENQPQNKVDLLDYATLKKLHSFQTDIELHEENFSNEQILIAELQKFTEEPKKIKLNEKPSREPKEIKEIIIEEISSSKQIEKMDLQKRNNETILRCLKQYHNFIKYMKFNNVSIDLLEKICPLLQHKHIPKDSYLFKENQKPNFFFGIIKGQIGLRTNDPDIILENKRKYENEEINMEQIYLFGKSKKKIMVNAELNNDENNELQNNEKNEISINNIIEEKRKKLNFEINYNNIPGIEKLIKEGYDLKILKTGDCYGIYNLLYYQSYEVNGLALEDTDIFYLEKDHFDKYLLNQILRIDLDRKYYINKIMPEIPMELLTHIQPEILENNFIIYTEFDYAFEAIYIYKGSAELKKYDLARSKSDIYEHKNILKTISKIDEGGIAGLEVCKGPNSFYDNTLVITEPNTIIYRINLFNAKGKKNIGKSAVKRFFSKLYEQQKTFLQKAEEKNKEYKEIYKIDTKSEKPKFNYSNFFNQIFKDVNPPKKVKRNKLILYKFQNIINSDKKIKSPNNNSKNLFNNRFKTLDMQKKFKNNCFLSNRIKDQKKYIINTSNKKSRNQDTKKMPSYNTLNTYNSLSAPSKIKNQKQRIIIPQNSKFSLFNDNIINNKVKSNPFRKELQKSGDFSFPRLLKNNSTNSNKQMFSYKIQNSKSTKFKSADKCIYDSGDFQIPFVTFSNSANDLKNLMKVNNLTHYSKLKKLILDKHFLC